MAANLTPAQREEFAYEAYEMSIKGETNRTIGKKLGISHGTVTSLIRKEAAKRREEHRDDIAKSVSHYRAIERKCWEVTEKLAPNSREMAAMMRAKIDAQDHIDQILGSKSPVKSNVSGTLNHQHRHLDLSEISDEELDMFERIIENATSHTD